MGSSVGREDGLDDLGVAGSEIFAFAHQPVQFGNDIVPNGDAKLRFCHDITRLDRRAPSAR